VRFKQKVYNRLKRERAGRFKIKGRQALRQPRSESVCWTSKLKTSREVWSGWWQKLSFLLNYAHNALLLGHYSGHSVCPLKLSSFLVWNGQVPLSIIYLWSLRHQPVSPLG
jgi:hypothetical protein